LVPFQRSARHVAVNGSERYYRARRNLASFLFWRQRFPAPTLQRPDAPPLPRSPARAWTFPSMPPPNPTNQSRHRRGQSPINPMVLAWRFLSWAQIRGAGHGFGNKGELNGLVKLSLGGAPPHLRR